MNNIIGNMSERTVYRYILKHFKERKAICLQHYPVFDVKNGNRYEPDNLIIDSELGVINIEVKGLQINNIERIEGHDWVCRDWYMEIMRPYKQAEKQVDAFVDVARKKGIVKDDITKSILIAIPFITRKEWESKMFDPICTPTIIFKDDLINGDWVEKLSKGILHKATPDITMEDYTSLDTMLIPTEVKPADVENLVFSKLWILSKSSDLNCCNKQMSEDMGKGIKTYVIIRKEDYDKLSFMKRKAFEDIGLLNVHTISDIISKEITITNGEGITDALSRLLEGIDGFNYRQYQAIHHAHDNNIAVEASAGTGKTYLLVDRVIYLLMVSPATLDDITIITFTNAATDEMRQRIQGRLLGLFTTTGNKRFLDLLENIRKLRISTIHSFSKSIIVRYADNLGIGRNIKVTGLRYEKRLLARRLMDEFMKGTKLYTVADLSGFKQYQVIDFIMKVLDEIEKKTISYDSVDNIRWSDENRVLNDIINYVVPRMDKLMLVRKREENMLEINDLIRMLGDITDLEPNDSKLRYLFVDEFQDSDNGQIGLFSKLINRLSYRVFAIGDIKQSVYRFRGADYTSFERLIGSVDSEIKRLSLINNYRSSRELLCEHNKIFNAFAGIGLLKYDKKDQVTGQKEFNAVIKALNVVTATNDDMAKERTVEIVRKLRQESPKDSISILVRSNGDIRKVREWFRTTGLMVNETVEGDFFTHEAVLGFRCILNSLIFHNDAKCLYDAYVSPYFGFRFDSTELMLFDGHNDCLKAYMDNRFGDRMGSYAQLMKKEPLLTVVNRIIKENGLYDNLYTSLLDRFPCANKEELKIYVYEYAENLHHLFKMVMESFDAESNSISNILEWLNINVKSNKKENAIHNYNKSADVEVMTIHKSKGLERDYVILPILNNSFSFRKSDVIIDMNDSNDISLSWKLDDDNRSDNYGHMYEREMVEVAKEEARLLYVAMTRAKKSVTLLKPEKPKNKTWARLLADAMEEI